MQEHALNINTKAGVFYEPQSFEKSAFYAIRIRKPSQNPIGNAHAVLSNLQIKVQG